MARKPRNPKPQSPEPTPPSLDQVIEQANLTTADQLPTLEEAAKRLGVWGHPEPEVELVVPEPTHVQRVRPEGPRKREPGESFVLAVDHPTGIRLEKKGRYLELSFPSEPQNDQVRKLYDDGFYRKPGSTTWASPASPEQIDAAYKLFNDFTGKTERYDVYRGR